MPCANDAARPPSRIGTMIDQTTVQYTRAAALLLHGARANTMPVT